MASLSNESASFENDLDSILTLYIEMNKSCNISDRQYEQLLGAYHFATGKYLEKIKYVCDVYHLGDENSGSIWEFMVEHCSKKYYPAKAAYDAAKAAYDAAKTVNDDDSMMKTWHKLSECELAVTNIREGFTHFDYLDALNKIHKKRMEQFNK
jgi:hypothetical protein